MRQDTYYRLHEACLAMANQSTKPEVEARWLAMAEAWLQRSMEISEHRSFGTYRATALVLRSGTTRPPAVS
jgi:hypothetical protein